MGELLAEFGDRFTVSELMFWYHNADKVVKKRPHAWGSDVVRDAALELYEQVIFQHIKICQNTTVLQ